ncbi:MAG TPA: class III signal peptide-containing protein [Gemmataceae bacterium]|nr:class III signal peptide-containing protein [Gemmataceae bacterium]
MMQLLKKLFRNKKGQGLVEYGLIIAGVALICAAAISLFGHKTNDLISAIAAVLPGAHPGDNGQIVSGHLIETTAGTANSPIQLDVATMATEGGQNRLGNNLLKGGDQGTDGGLDGLIVESK